MSADPIEEWVKKAESSYLSALDLARRRKFPVPDVICNLCQQCAEKYLKVLLVRHKVHFPRVHDLDQLEDLVARVEPDIRVIHKYVKPLNPYGVDIRYPGLTATVEEAREAIKAMKKLRRFARAKLGLKSQ